jgi:hypothetical protein
MPNKSRKQKSKTKIYFKSKYKFTGGKNLRRSKIRKKGRVTKHIGGEWFWKNWFKKKTPNNPPETFVTKNGNTQPILYPLDGKKVQEALKHDSTNFKGKNFNETNYGYGYGYGIGTNGNNNTISMGSNNYPLSSSPPSNNEINRLTNQAKINILTNQAKKNHHKFSRTYEINKQTIQTLKNKEQKEKEESNRIAQKQKTKKKEEALKCLENISMNPEILLKITTILESA